jgi:outer membrane protein, heavy metal efflux system
MSRMKLRTCLWIVLFSMNVTTIGAQTISEELQQRSGHGLAELPRDGPVVFSLPPGIALTDIISADDAVAIALWNNSALQAELAGLDVSKAELVDAGQFRNPSFSALMAVGPKPFEFLLSWPIEELWQRSQRIKAARLNVDAVSTALIQNGLDVIRDVRASHADLWLAQARSRILQESADLRGNIATLTERRREAGDATGLDVSLAQADAQSTAELARLALGDVEIARSRFRLLLGMRGSSAPLSTPNERIDRPGLPTLAALMDIAMVNRPDLRAAELRVQASAAKAKWQHSQVLAMMAPTLSIKEVGDSGLRVGPGLNMEIPILSQNKGRIARANAEVVQAARQYVALKDRIEQEVVEARERVIQAMSSLGRFRQQVRPPVDQSIRLTERAYANGDVSFLNVIEATRQRYDLDLREAEIYANSERARAELERAIGRKL